MKQFFGTSQDDGASALPYLSTMTAARERLLDTVNRSQQMLPAARKSCPADLVTNAELLLDAVAASLKIISGERGEISRFLKSHRLAVSTAKSRPDGDITLKACQALMLLSSYLNRDPKTFKMAEHELAGLDARGRILPHSAVNVPYEWLCRAQAGDGDFSGAVETWAQHLSNCGFERTLLNLLRGRRRAGENTELLDVDARGNLLTQVMQIKDFGGALLAIQVIYPPLEARRISQTVFDSYPAAAAVFSERYSALLRDYGEAGKQPQSVLNREHRATRIGLFQADIARLYTQDPGNLALVHAAAAIALDQQQESYQLWWSIARDLPSDPIKPCVLLEVACAALRCHDPRIALLAVDEAAQSLRLSRVTPVAVARFVEAVEGALEASALENGDRCLIYDRVATVLVSLTDGRELTFGASAQRLAGSMVRAGAHEPLERLNSVFASKYDRAELEISGPERDTWELSCFLGQSRTMDGQHSASLAEFTRAEDLIGAKHAWGEDQTSARLVLPTRLALAGRYALAAGNPDVGLHFLTQAEEALGNGQLTVEEELQARLELVHHSVLGLLEKSLA